MKKSLSHRKTSYLNVLLRVTLVNPTLITEVPRHYSTYGPHGKAYYI